MVLDAAVAVDLTYAPGVRLTRASASDDPLQGGRVRVATIWHVDDAASFGRPLVWQVQLTNSADQVVHRASGMDHVPASLHGQSMLSWFTLDTPREIGPAPYQVHLRLVEADRGAQIGDEWVSPPFGVTQTARCRA
jgi:hypothetical protein